MGRYVQLAGYRGDINVVIASMDALLMPSPAETFGRVIIEGMASGTPVVASSGGGVSSLITHGVNGSLAKPLNVHEMSEGLRDCYEHPEKRKRIIDNGVRGAAETYHYDKVYRKLFDLLGV